ncbi:MAG: thioesterase family protein [Polyangiaceae bacterium]
MSEPSSSTASDPEAPSDLARDTAVTRVGKTPHQYVARLSDQWNYLLPSGGVLLSIGLRAIEAELARSDLRVLSATAMFCSPVRDGLLDVRATVLRSGENAAQTRATVTSRADGGPGVEIMATFVRARTGPDTTGVEMPNVSPPLECPVVGSRRADLDKQPFRSRPTFFRQVDVTQAIGSPFDGEWSAGPAHVGFWHRYRVPQRLADGTFDPLALPPIADTLPGSLVRKVGPDHPRFIAPSLDLTVFFLAPTTSEWILVESFCERSREGWANCSGNLWDERGQLVARVAQTMTLKWMP